MKDQCEQLINLDEEPYASSVRDTYCRNRYEYLLKLYPNQSKLFDKDYLNWEVTNLSIIQKINIHSGNFYHPSSYLQSILSRKPKPQQFNKIKKQQLQPIIHFQDSNIQILSDQENSQSQISQGLIVTLEVQKGRKKNYICQHCKIFQHYGKKQLNVHKTSCKVRKSLKRKIRENKHSQHILNYKKTKTIQKIYEEEKKEQENSKQKAQYNQANLIQNRIVKLQKTVYTVMNPDQLQKSQLYRKQMNIYKQIMEELQKPILGTIGVHMKRLVQSATNSSIQIQDIKHNISLNLLKKINEIDFSSLIFDYSQKLIESYNLIKIQDQKKDIRTQRNNQYGFRFLEKYNQFTLFNQTELVSDLMALSGGQRNNIRRFFKKVKKVSGYFSNFPDIPKLGFNLGWRRSRPSIKIDQIAYQVALLLKSESIHQKILGVDIWTCVCFGLRSPDLQKIVLLCKDNSIAHSVKLIERKNNKESIRYVPESLAQIVRVLNVSFPMDCKRIRQARQFSINKFGTFYGARHLMIMTVLGSLSQSSDYASFHKNNKTTHKHYLTQQQETLLDAAFQIPIEFKKKIERQKRQFIIDVTGFQQVQYKKIRSVITIDNAIDVKLDELNDKDCIFSGQIKIQEIDNFQEIKQDEKKKLKTQKLIYDKVKREVIECDVKDLQEVISDSTMNKESFKQALFTELENQGLPKNQENIVQATSSLCKVDVVFLNCNTQNQSIYIKDDKFEKAEETEEKFYVGKDKLTDKYHSIENTQLSFPKNQPKHQRASKIKAYNSIKKYSQVLLTLRNPKCDECRNGQYETTLKDSKCVVICSICEKIRHPTYEKIDDNNLPTIYSNSDKQIDFGIKCVQLTKKKNNLVTFIKQKYGAENYSYQLTYSPQIPKLIVTNYPRFSKNLEKEIIKNMKNEEHLPLKITKSKIDLKGFGISTTQEILPNKLIISYVGTVKSTYSFNHESNSLFTLGWLCGNNFKAELIIQPSEKLNAARYINSSQTPNCMVRYGVFDNKSVLLLIISSVKIKAGQQLTYSYGPKYFESTNTNSIQNNSSDQQI